MQLLFSSSAWIALSVTKGGIFPVISYGFLLKTELDLANSIYIDWGAFISSIINFLIVAFVLFLVVRTMNRIAKAHERMMEGLDLDEKKEIFQIRKEQRVSRKEAVEIYEAKVEQLKAEKAAAEEAAAAKAAEEAAAAKAAEEERPEPFKTLEIVYALKPPAL